MIRVADVPPSSPLEQRLDLGASLRRRARTPPQPASASPAEVDRRLDDALAMTFPASDPVAISSGS
jgi:hypothetical protein